MDNTITERKKVPRMTYAQAGEINGMLPPQAVELEKSVLGALMLDRNALWGVIDKLHEGLFYRTEHQAVFEAITKLIFQGKDTDLGGDAGKVWTAIKKDDRFKSQLS